jgi:nucleotide-binding universal stress UspA family protein
MVRRHPMAQGVAVGPAEGSQVSSDKEPERSVAAGNRGIRRSFEAGHSPKFLVLVDDTLDCGKAVHYASRRATRVGAKLVLLRVIEPPPIVELGLLGVEDVMRSEQQQEAQQLLDSYVSRAERIAGITPETVIQQGDTAEKIFKLIESDEDIAVLVLAAGSSKEGPGPLISGLARTAGTYPIPIVIVPAQLTDHELDALS